MFGRPGPQMPPVYQAWFSRYAHEDFDWDPKKSLTTFADRDFVFEAARIVFRSRLVRRQDTRRQRRREARFIVLGELYDRVVVVIYTPRGGKCRIISMRLANALESDIYHGYKGGQPEGILR